MSKLDLDQVRERVIQMDAERARRIVDRFLALKFSDKQKIAKQFNDPNQYYPVVFVDRKDLSQKEWATAFLTEVAKRRLLKDIEFFIAKLDIDG